MNRKLWTVLGVVSVAALLAAGITLTTRPRGENKPKGKDEAEKVRQPAVAGLFYPAHKEDLARMVDALLARAQAERLENVRALISPHAGYPYSGGTAAQAYSQLRGRKVHTVVILAPSHCASFDGASIADADAYQTPLGRIAVSAKARALAKSPPFVMNPPCQVHRPSWWQGASKELPAFGADTPHTWEHSLEVQLPFLQRVLKDFAIVPVVYGRADPEQAAKVLMEQIAEDGTVFVASSDLSHYHPYAEAQALDHLCIEAILKLDVEAMNKQEACGKAPILTLMHMARHRGWKPTLLEYCNSGDTGDDRTRVVGYAAIAFLGPAAAGPQTQPTQPAKAAYSPAERSLMLRLARQSVEKAAANADAPQVDTRTLPSKLLEDKGCFVTLTVGGNLRGCIGHIFPREPLYRAVVDNARSAAMQDKRFSPVRPDELDQIEVEVSVLTVPQRLNFGSPAELVRLLRPGIDGVVLQAAQRQSTFLPQVWQQLPDKVLFLNRLAMKAGLPAWAWQHPQAVVWVYQAEAFKESET